MINEGKKIQRLPRWMKMKMPAGKNYSRIKNLVEKNTLHTICSSGNCPNIGECWGKGTATFMILGDICTRSCKFCGVKTGKPLPPDLNEPERIAHSVKLLELKHCVITSVDRDDLKDGGAGHWAKTLLEIKRMNPQTTIEALIPDFNGDKSLINKITSCKTEVISHNLETVERLTPIVRSKAKYDTSLKVIKIISENNIISKSGIMLGLGETEEEIYKTMDDLLNQECKVLTLGQYLQPSFNHIEVKEFIHPEKFEKYKSVGLQKGFKHVESHPLVRSSYQAEKHAKP